VGVDEVFGCDGDDSEDENEKEGMFDFLFRPLPSNHRMRMVWNTISILFTVYLLIVVPLESFILPKYDYFEGEPRRVYESKNNFNPTQPTPTQPNPTKPADGAEISLVLLNACDIMADIFFLTDFLFRLFYFDDDNVIYDKKSVTKTIYKAAADRDKNEDGEAVSIQWAYLEHSMFWVDFWSIFPFDHFARIQLDSVGIYRMNKLLRLIRLVTYARSALDVLERKGYLRHIGLQRMWSLFFLSAVGGHWAGCVFYYVSLIDTKDGEVLDTWLLQDNLVVRSGCDSGSGSGSNSTTACSYMVNPSDNTTLPQMYNRALYWAYVTMITTGFGDITPHSTSETLVCIASMYVGVLITCAAIANLTLLVSKFDQAANDYHQKLDNVNKYLSYQQVPASLGNKIRQYYEYQWNVLKGVDENLFMKELTPQLQQMFQENLMREYLSRVDVFKKAPPSLITGLLGFHVMERIMLSPGDMIVEKGTVMGGMYMLVQGLAEVMSSNGSGIQAIWRKGENVGGASLLIKNITVENSIKAKVSELVEDENYVREMEY